MIFPWRGIDRIWPLFPVVTILGIGVLILTRLPRIKLHGFEDRALMLIGIASSILAVLATGVVYLLNLPVPHSVPLIFGLVYFLNTSMMRVLALRLLIHLTGRASSTQKVAIYGAGAAGIQLATALARSREARPIFFVDDNPHLHRLVVAGLSVHAPQELPQLAAKHGVSRVLLAMPSVSKVRHAQIIEALSEHDFDVQVLPSYVDLMAENGLAASMRPVAPDELLSRDKVALDVPEISMAYAGRVVMVTGAGGSIGSELCRQILDCRPRKLVLFEQNEFSLYTIDIEMQAFCKSAGIALSTRLGSVTNRTRVAEVIEAEGVEIILHAAAYKHVPLVEENAFEGVQNNVFGTQVLAEVAMDTGIERFILVSTDKAVRPTNVMGASKRLAELVIQDLQSRSELTKFAMVRFGNVLGSSGSFMPLFQRQIEQGGPVTVTHPEVTRFFMTIPEASRLVLLAGAFAEGGDVFVLDMGKPQKILDVARRMIELSGHGVYDPDSGEGDIAIEITGLRSGEKLYEELLIDDSSLRGTPHPKILRARESKLSQFEIASTLRDLRSAIEGGSQDQLRSIISVCVDGYQPYVAAQSMPAE